GLALVAFAVSFPLPQGGRAFVTGPVPDAFSQALAERRISSTPIGLLAERFRKPTASPPPAKKPPAAASRTFSPRSSPAPRGRGIAARTPGSRGSRTSRGRGGR